MWESNGAWWMREACACHDVITCTFITSQIARFMGPTKGPHGADRTQVGRMLAPWTLLSGLFPVCTSRIRYTCHTLMTRFQYTVARTKLSPFCKRHIWIHLFLKSCLDFDSNFTSSCSIRQCVWPGSSNILVQTISQDLYHWVPNSLTSPWTCMPFCSGKVDFYRP